MQSTSDQFYSGGHFSERAAAAQWSEKVNHLNCNKKTFKRVATSVVEQIGEKK